MEFISILTQYGLDTLVLALAIVAMTGLIKLPVKCLAEKAKSSKKITRFITFMPIILGFGLTVLFSLIINGKVTFTREFYVEWLSSVSLSLAIYAFWEKFVPSEKSILSESEIAANIAVVEELTSKFIEEESASAKPSIPEDVISDEHQTVSEQTANHSTIILTANNKFKEL